MQKIVNVNVTINISRATEPVTERSSTQEQQVSSGKLGKNLKTWLTNHSSEINVGLMAVNLLLKVLNMF